MSEAQENACPMAKSEEEAQQAGSASNTNNQEPHQDASTNVNDKPSENCSEENDKQGECVKETEAAKNDELIKVTGEGEKLDDIKQTTTTGVIDVENGKEDDETKLSDTDERTSKSVSVGTVTNPLSSEAQEVSSSINGKTNRSIKAARRSSYNVGRAYYGNFQNYGLTYLPYKSNFEPSEDARRKADEFLKTLKL